MIEPAPRVALASHGLTLDDDLEALVAGASALMSRVAGRLGGRVSGSLTVQNLFERRGSGPPRLFLAGLTFATRRL